MKALINKNQNSEFVKHASVDLKLNESNIICHTKDVIIMTSMKRVVVVLMLMASIMFTVVAEPQATHEEHKEQKIISINTTKLTFDYKVPAGWHVVAITAIEGEIVIVLEKN